MNILFVVPYVPDRIRTRSYHLVRQLAAHGHHVTVATVWTSPIERRSVEELRRQGIDIRGTQLPLLRSAWNCIRALPGRLPLQAAFSWSPGAARAMTALLAGSNGRRPFDLVHIEHLRGALYGLWLKRQGQAEADRPPIVWDSVDCISLLFQQAAQRSRSAISRWATRFETERTARLEGSLLSEFDQVLATSEFDAQALQSLGNGRRPPRPVSVLSNGVDAEYFTPGDPAGRVANRLIMTGKMSYHANVTMAAEFVTNILPRVAERHPDVELWIVGKDPAREVCRLARPGRVHVTGTVPDVRPYLRTAAVAVAPVSYGAGIQNKVLEAMSCGTATVISDIAARGLSLTGEGQALVRTGEAEFAQGVSDLLSSPAARARLGEAGRRYVQQHHDWGRITLRLEEIYHGLIRARA
jgi:glycosyltransferase involved in cell wall biosynthesis